MKNLTYFAHPIDQGDTHPAIAAVLKSLYAAGLNLYRPLTAFELMDTSSSTRRAVDQINRAAIDACGRTVAVLPYGAASLGTPVEIERSLLAGKPTAIFTDQELISGSVQLEAWRELGAVIYDYENLPSADRMWRDLPDCPPSAVPLIPWQRTAVAAVAPSKAYPDDAGIDLAALEATAIDPGAMVSIRTGVALAMPEGMWGMIVGRSSTWHQHRLLVIPSVIDAGWRGELQVPIKGLGYRTETIEAGQRIGQIIPLPAWAGRLVPVHQLPEHERGLNGFGSSGV